MGGVDGVGCVEGRVAGRGEWGGLRCEVDGLGCGESGGLRVGLDGVGCGVG